METIDESDIQVADTNLSKTSVTAKTTPHKIPSSAQVRYYFDHNSGTTEPILMIFFKYAQSDSLQQFFCICHISRDFLKKPLRHLNLTTFLPISPDPMSRFCSSSNLASQIKIEVLKKKLSKSVQIYSSYRDDGQMDRWTDGQTDRRMEFFFCIFG